MRLSVVIAIALVVILSPFVRAEQQFGMEVFPGSSIDANLTTLSKESADKMQEGLPPANRIQFEQSVFVSSEPFDKILAFYEEKFGMKAAPFNPEKPTPLGPEGFALIQEIEMKDAVTSAKFFNPALDPTKFSGKVRLALFNKPSLPMVSVMDKGLNWKDGAVIEKSIISITKQPELPKLPVPSQDVKPAPVPAAK